jgi:hypothetical protein
MAADRKVIPFAVPLFFGILSLLSMVGRGRLAPYSGPDIVQLIGTGMCFGVALAGLVLLLRGRRAG